MPGLLGAERRLRPRERADARAARGRRVGDRRPEDLDLLGRSGPTGASCVCRTDPAPKAPGLSYLLVPMRSPASRSARSCRSPATPSSARCSSTARARAADNVVGAPGEGWKVAMGTLAFERGASTLGQQLAFRNELAGDRRRSRSGTGARRDPLMRQRLADAWMGLEILRFNALRTLSGARAPSSPRAAMIHKLFWATWHRELGKLAMDVLGPEAEIAGRRAVRADARCSGSSSSRARTRSTPARTRSSAT